MVNASAKQIFIKVAPLSVSSGAISEEDVCRLDENMLLLNNRGMGKLNKRLEDTRGGAFWDTIAEHNFAVKLCRQHPQASICYEPDPPDQGKRPIDFVMGKGSLTFQIQMKKLSKLEWDNRRDKFLMRIKEEAKKIKIGKWFEVTLSVDFDEVLFQRLIEFIKEKAQLDSEQTHIFDNENNRTEVTFRSPPSAKLAELTYAGGMTALEARDVTGEDCGQMKKSFQKAAESFNHPTGQNNINLIAMEADNKHDLDICDALFGSEVDVFSGDGKHYWDRKADGVFLDQCFAEKVAGVIALKRKKEIYNPPFAEVEALAKKFGMPADEYMRALQQQGIIRRICDYDAILYMNDKFEHLLGDIKTILQFDMVIDRKMRPKGSNFTL